MPSSTEDMDDFAEQAGEYVCDAFDVIDLKLISKGDEVRDECNTWNPEFTHQVYGETERIFGYKDLLIKLYYTAGGLTPYLTLEYEKKVDPKQTDGIEADNCLLNICEILPKGSESVKSVPYYSNEEEFMKTADEERFSFRPMGELRESWPETSTPDGPDCKSSLELWKSSPSTPRLKEYVDRIYPFLLWHIECASPIDLSDDRWLVYLVFKKKTSRDSGEVKSEYIFAGYATVYQYYAYPEMIRPRISQVLILPPFQKKGLCSRVLQGIYNDLRPLKNVLDFTVEDPSPNFTHVRDFVDTQNALALPFFHNIKSGEVDINSLPMKEVVAELQKSLKLNKTQCRKVYEIIKMKFTNTSDPEKYKTFRLEVKKRLNSISHDRISKLQKPPEERLTELDQMYKNTEEDYRSVLNNLALYGSS